MAAVGEDLGQAGAHLRGAVFSVELDADVAGVGLQVGQSPWLAAGLVIRTDAEVPRSGRRVLDPSSKATAWPERRLPHQLDREAERHRLGLKRPAKVAMPRGVVVLFVLVAERDAEQGLLAGSEPSTMHLLGLGKPQPPHASFPAESAGRCRIDDYLAS